MELPAIKRDDAGRLLAAVLQRVQAKRSDGGGVRMPKYAEDAALLAHAVTILVGGGARTPVSSNLLACDLEICVGGSFGHPARLLMRPSPLNVSLSRRNPAPNGGDRAASADPAAAVHPLP